MTLLTKPLLVAVMLNLLALLYPSIAFAELDFIEDASGKRSDNQRNLIQWTHSRLVFTKEVERVAVGQNKTLEVEIIGGKELLILAKSVGRTTLIVWYTNGNTETFLFSVTEDLSVLQSALRDIHPAIRLELAPDRPALALRGKVPTVDFKVAAEAAARHYLGAQQNAGNTYANSQAGNQLQSLSDSLQMIISSQSNDAGSNNNGKGFRVNPQNLSSRSRVAIINLIQVEQLPQTVEEKISELFATFKGSNISIKRISRGDLANDKLDTLLLEGEVPDQVTLTRVLNIAARYFIGEGEKDMLQIKAITDEAGGLINQRQATRSQSGLLGQGGSSFKNNDIGANIARSKLLSIGGGRILSTIKVKDIPQIRVSVQIHEINRNLMKSWQPNFNLITNDYNADGNLSLGQFSNLATGENSVENALQVLGGTLSNNLQVGGSKVAFDLLFSLMEQEGISKSLSRPTITMLAGESAVFNVGGEIPIPTAFAPSGLSSGDNVGANTSGVFSGTTFKAFGVSLKVRAMVDEDDKITLDVNPTISSPDTLLTQQITSTTGSSLNSSAFNVRSINTTTQLIDGQPLVLAGLVYSEHSSADKFVPGANQVPLLGKLAQAYSDTEQERELVIVVTPTLVRETRAEVNLWAFPDTLNLVESALIPTSF